MKINRGMVATLVGVAIVVLVNLSVADKEHQLESGQVIFLKLAPVDPRSLMQGDYMALNYEIANPIYQALPKNENAQGWRNDLDARDGAVVVTVDNRSVASYSRLDDGSPLQANEHLLRFRVRGGQLKFATNAYFFQEGTAHQYEEAEYGLFRVNEDGEPLLAHMADTDLNILPTGME